MQSNNPNILTVIPARAGSQRLPGKNKKMLGDKALIAWTLESALQSLYVKDIAVSTDDVDIVQIANSYGVAVPTMRPATLATAEAATVDVIVHVLDECRSQQKKYDYILLLQPTSPFRTAQQIDEAIESALEKKADAVISVCQNAHPHQWSNVLPADHSMTGFISAAVKQLRSQDLKNSYRLNGAIYLCSVDCFLQEKTFFLSDNVYATVMDQRSSVDIDTLDDFLYAEFLLKYHQS